MQRTKIVTGIVIFSCLIACGKRHHKAPPVAPVEPRPKPASCATEMDQSLDPARKVQRKTVELRRQRQRTIRRDCDKRVVSDGMELIEMPMRELVILPLSTKEAGLTGSAYNRTTCSGAGAGLGRVLVTMIFPWTALLEGNRSQIKLTVNSSPTFDHMHVRKFQDNFIDYEFVRCLKMSDKNCAQTETAERGTLVLTVNYLELPDIETPREKDNCQQDPKKN
jgi:hypothetical protein